MSTFTDFFFGSNIAVWVDAIGEIFEQMEDQRQAALAAVYLSSAAISDLNDRYAVYTNGQIDSTWQLEVFREHLQETIQAFLMMSATERGISQAVAATTMIPPTFRPSSLIQRWLLGFQNLPNRFFLLNDGRVCSTVDGPYVIDESNNILIITVDGAISYTVTLPVGDAITAAELVLAINVVLNGASATLYGHRLCLMTDSGSTSGSIQVQPASTADTLLGFDNYLHQNAPAGTGLQGTLPLGWRITAPPGSVSIPSSSDAALFGVGPIIIKGTQDSPFVGIASSAFTSNGGFESDFAQWDNTDGPDFFISYGRVRSGAKSLGIMTRDPEDPDGAPIVNTLKSDIRILPAEGITVSLTAYHQALSNGPVYTSPASPASKFRWTTSNEVYGYAHKQVGEDPIIDPASSTCKLTDPAVNFVATGVIPGMAVHVEANGLLYEGVVKGVATHDLYIDQWRKSKDEDSRTAHVTDPGGFSSGITYSAKALVDTSPQAGALTTIIQTGTTTDVRDKIRVPETTFTVTRRLGAQPVVKQAVRDIIGVTEDNGVLVVTVADWGTMPTPAATTPYFIYVRPPDGSAYKIFSSLGDIVTSTDTVASPVSAQFQYSFFFYDKNLEFIAQDDSGFLVPTPGLGYTQVLFEAPAPLNAKYTQLQLTVLADTTGSGALATIDDISWRAKEDVVPELHIAIDDRMQKVEFRSEATPAVGTITYTTLPRDSDTVTIGTVTYEFDSGTQAKGVLTWFGQPLDGDLFQIGSFIYEFDNDCIVGAGHIQVLIGATAADSYKNLADAVGAVGTGIVSATYDAANTQITFTARIFGPAGNNIFFLKSSAQFGLLPSSGFLAGGDVSGFTLGNIPVQIPPNLGSLVGFQTIHDVFATLVSLINANSPEVTATLNTTKRTVTITSNTTGQDGNEIAFTGVSAVPAYTFNPGSGFLNSGTGLDATGFIVFTNQPSDGDLFVIGNTGYEFDSDSSGLCGESQLININPSGLSFTLSGLTSAVNARGEAIAVYNGSLKRVDFTAPPNLGAAGNTIPFRETSSVISITPNQGDFTAQGATATINNSRAYDASLVTYQCTATPPTVTAVASSSTTSTVSSGVLAIPSNIPVGAMLVVQVYSPSITPGIVTPTVTDTKGNIYSADAAFGSATSFVFSRIIGSSSLVGGSDAIIVTLGGGNSFNGLTISVLQVLGACPKDKTAHGSGTSTSLVITPSTPLNVSGELVITAFGTDGPSTDTFTPPLGHTTIGRSGTGAGGGQNTLSPTYKVMTSSHLDGAITSSGLIGDSATCGQLARYLNARLSGILTYCEVVSGIYPNGRLVFQSLYSGIDAVMTLGHGSANLILGFEDDEGLLNDSFYRRPAWEVDVGASGVVEFISRALPQSSKYFGTEWHARFWAKAYHPSGISVSGITRSGLKAYAAFSFDSGIYQTGSIVSLGEIPSVVEVIDLDLGRPFTTADVRLTVSGVTSGIRLAISEPYFINETSKTLHIDDNTIPRNKQREYKMYRLNVANPDDYTNTETGLIGMLSDVAEEPFVLTDNELTDLDNANIFPRSETVERLGVRSQGQIAYNPTVLPLDGDTITLGTDVYEFDNNFALTNTNAIQIVIGFTPESTMLNFVDQVNSNSLTHQATIDTVLHVVTVRAIEAGTAGDTLVFTASSAALVLSPTSAHLTGGVDAIPYLRDVDYVILNGTGQIRRADNSNIPSPSPSDLVISYSYHPAGIHHADSYTQTLKPVGIKVEPDFTSNFFFYGYDSDFRSVSGVAISGVNGRLFDTKVNLDAVTRIPSRFSYLKPRVAGRHAEVVSFSGVGYSAPITYNAMTTQEAIVLKNGVALPNSADGWTFVNDKTMTIAAAEFDPTATYEVEYLVKFQYQSTPIAVPETTTTYILSPYSYKVRRADEVNNDVEKVLALDENRQATLVLPAITDQSLAEITKTVAGESEIINDEFWQFVDDSTVEIFVAAFDDAATYTLTYKSREIQYNSPVNEQWEYAISTDANTWTPWFPFTPGDRARLDNYVRFRVTSWGDFDVDEYRIRSLAGVVDNPDLSGCGFGIEPFAKTPFGGCSEESFPDPAVINVGLGGTLALQGTLSVEVNASDPLPLATGRWYFADSYHNTSAGSLAANTVYAAVKYVGGTVTWTGIGSGFGNPGSGNIAYAIYECDAQGKPNNLVYSTGIIAAPGSSPTTITISPAVTTTTPYIAIAVWTSAIRGFNVGNGVGTHVPYGNISGGLSASANGTWGWTQATASGPQNPGVWATVNVGTTLIPRIFVQVGSYS